MNLDKAIKILATHQAQIAFDNMPDLRNAIKLGGEALNARERDRAFGYVDLDDLLPGETKE